MPIQTAIDSISQNQGSPFGFKNRIINGGMVIDQRNAGASVTPGSGSSYTLDRWKNYNSQSSKLSFQQNAGSVTPPVGFTNYLGATSLSAYSVGSSDEFDLYQLIEGYNMADFGWGTANAQTVTLSFWVRSSLTGTFGGTIANAGNSRNYPFSYTISASNTWERKSINVVGDTTGTWLTTNGVGISLLFSLGAGSSLLGTAGTWTGTSTVGATGQVNLVGTNGATFYITGVQLEKGSTATAFDYRPYGAELQLCQRYFEIIGSGQNSILVGGYGGSELNFVFKFSTQKRATSTMTKVGTWSSSNIAAEGFTSNSIDCFSYYLTPTGAARTYIYNSNAGAYFTASAEL